MDAREALAIYVAAVKPGSGAMSAELAAAAADVAERSGAPAFAAAVLSSASAGVAAPALAQHLLRTAELYVAAGDAVRARVVVDFLRTQRQTRALRGPRWARLLRDLAMLRAAKAPSTADATRPHREDERSTAAPELVAAARALERARVAVGGDEGAQP